MVRLRKNAGHNFNATNSDVEYLEKYHALSVVGEVVPAVKATSASASVAILLCTFHGQHFLADQLDSIDAQNFPHWRIWASDDGSQDDTHIILDAYQRKWGSDRLCIQHGPALGFARNFLSLTCDQRIEADYYAWSDQDDIWEADKLQRALDCLSRVPAGVPALYCSRTRLVNAENQEIGLSACFSKPASFANALMQSIGGGNTMVFNDAARKLLCEAGPDVEVISHDCWAYMVVSGCGGRVYYDSYPSLRYRQHGANLVGTNLDWRAKLDRIRRLGQGWFREWNDRNIVSLYRLHRHLTPENQQVLDLFSNARKRWMLPRLIGLKKSGIYRQTFGGNVGLFVAAIFKKI